MKGDSMINFIYDYAKGEVDDYEKGKAAWKAKEGALKKDQPKKQTTNQKSRSESRDSCLTHRRFV